MKQLIHNYNDWMCFSINHLNIAFFFFFFKLLKVLSGEFPRVVSNLPPAEIANAVLFLKRACSSSWNSAEAQPSSGPWMSGSVFGLETWVSRVHLIMIWISFGGFSWNHLVECAARCGLGLLTQPCTQLRFILFTPGIVWSTFQTVAASVTDPSCNCIKGISLLRKHHSWIFPNVNWDSSMSLIKDGTFRLYLLCSKQKSLSFYNLHFTICRVFPPVLLEGVFALWI